MPSGTYAARLGSAAWYIGSGKAPSACPAAAATIGCAHHHASLGAFENSSWAVVTGLVINSGLPVCIRAAGGGHKADTPARTHDTMAGQSPDDCTAG